jgi:group I intron endonuclease
MKTDFWVKKYCGIYCIQNKTTSMAYVGQSVDIVKRWSAHTTPGKKSSGIQKAIKEAGIEAFHFFVLEICLREELNDREIHWIKTYDCIHPKGYNGNSGGGAPTKVSDEAKKKMSVSAKGKKLSEETKAKMSKPKSPETIAKMSAARIEYWKNKGALKVSSESPLD